MNYVVLSCDADPALKNLLRQKGLQLIELVSNKSVYPAVSAHPDIFVCKLGLAPESPLFCGTPADYDYPGCASLCACCTETLFVHNLRVTDRALLKTAEDLGKLVIHVNQGFTRCNLLPVGDRAFITSDAGIAKSLAKNGITDVLLINPGNILLPGHETGFVGGCAGRVADSIVFNGDLSKHPDHPAIERFVESHGLKTEYTKGYPLTDIGSIIETERQIPVDSLGA